MPAPTEEEPKAGEAAEEAAVEVTPAEEAPAAPAEPSDTLAKEAPAEGGPAAPAEPSDDVAAEVSHAPLERGVGFEGVRPGAI